MAHAVSISDDALVEIFVFSIIVSQALLVSIGANLFEILT
jgi:hypothetical protein